MALRDLLNDQTSIPKVYLGEFVDPIEFANSENEDSERHGEHHHGQYGPHFWFDPIRVIQAVEKISDEMDKIDPPGAPRGRTHARYVPPAPATAEDPESGAGQSASPS